MKKCPVGLRCKAMVTRPIHCLRFVVLARIPQKHHATPQKPVQSSQYIAGIVRIARIARIPRQCNHSHSRTTSYASGNTGAPRGYFCTFADGPHISMSNAVVIISLPFPNPSTVHHGQPREPGTLGSHPSSRPRDPLVVGGRNGLPPHNHLSR